MNEMNEQQAYQQPHPQPAVSDAILAELQKSNKYLKAIRIGVGIIEIVIALYILISCAVPIYLDATRF